PGLGGGLWPEQSRADAGVCGDVHRGQVRIGRVPDLRDDLTVADVALEGAFVLGAVQEPPARARVADAVAEKDRESPPHKVDEVAHVVLETAVVIAAEEHPSLSFNKGPASEMDRLHAGEILMAEQITRGEFSGPENDGRIDATEPTRLDETERAELV